MSFSIGLEPVKGTVHLKQHSGLEWQFRWGNKGDPFPAGAQLYLLVGPESTAARWDFDIVADQANLKVTAPAAAAVADRTPFYLVFKQNASAQPETLALGRVRRWKADR